MSSSLDVALGYVSPTPAWVRGGLADSGAFLLEARAAEAVTATARQWPGAVTVLVPEILEVPASAALPDGLAVVGDTDVAVNVRQSGHGPEAVDRHGFDIVTGLLAPHMLDLVQAQTPIVLTAEVDWRIRWGIQRALGARGINALRVLAGLGRQELRIRRAAGQTAGLQCNGPAASHAYSGLTHESLTYYDHRVRASDLEAARDVSGWDGQGALRLGFSGRLDPIKGPQFALEATRRARVRGLNVELTIFGAGPLEEELRRSQDSGIRFAGFRAFRDEWLPEVRESIDLMVLPHPQGDPSCTYFESLGSGCPVLGFRNSTLTPLAVDHGLGWAVEPGNVDGLVERLAQIMEDPQSLADARLRGLEFMGEHTFEKTVQKRVEHTVRCLQAAGR
ncbi:glycosyltransferase family 4 protein [Kocuria sp.]|uniref:glycosyltransferase family 4 protein n=1 Tax=Kocuria sp. TaxID=1871328 RepID=UPI0026DF3B4F|nr:glycosyltransferase [Kocuria sp.]MDO5618395.1 glycosyltransferase [Kocuria sp.]